MTYPQTHGRMYRDIFTGMIVLLVQIPGLSQPFKPAGKETVIQTKEGMVLSGSVGSTSQELVTLRTPYGILDIPLNRIHRMDGDRFDVDEGILREHAVAIDKTGNVTLDYIVPISSRRKDEWVNVLTPGKVIEILDLDGRSLSFVAQERGGYTRCTVRVPEVYLPALRARVLLKQAGRIEGERLAYTYRYTPRSDQLFRLELVLPEGASEIDTAPEAVRTASGTIVFERHLRRQQTEFFEISFAPAPPGELSEP